jgi:hypothetical protein
LLVLDQWVDLQQQDTREQKHSMEPWNAEEANN